MLNRPETVFSEIGTQAIEQGVADPRLSAFYDSVMSMEGVENAQQRLKPFLPQLSLCSDRMFNRAPPPIFYVGQDSCQRYLFGEDWASPDSPSAALRTPDPELELASAEGYRNALNGQPYYGYARARVSVNGVEYEVAFERLIMAVRPTIQSEKRFCAFYGVIQDLHRKF